MEFSQEEVDFYLDDLEQMLIEFKEMDLEIQKKFSSFEKEILFCQERLQKVNTLSDIELETLSDDLDTLSETLDMIEETLEDSFEEEDQEEFENMEIDDQQLSEMQEHLGSLFSLMSDKQKESDVDVGNLKQVVEQLMAQFPQSDKES